jgi:hypothetical protein
VAKKDLVGAVQAPLQDGRLKFAEALPLTAVLVRELAAFRVKVTLAGNETFEAWRERDHDDLVLAGAAALSLGVTASRCQLAVVQSLVSTESSPRPRDAVLAG